MNNKNTVNKLSEWLRMLINEAKNDTSTSVFWFEGTDSDDDDFSIVGGWHEGFPTEYSDLFCLSQSNPGYGMCVKIVVNEGPYASANFGELDMPIDKCGEVDSPCISLEWDEDVEGLAEFLLIELERINKEFGGED